MKWLLVILLFCSCYMMARQPEYEVTSAQLISIKTMDREDKPYYELKWLIDERFYVYTYGFDSVYAVGEKIPLIIQR